MKISRPSPAMVVASIALFVALGGTSIAAVNYARNAGKVDGKDAVRASASLNRAAGNLVATKKRGKHKGKIPGRFVASVPTAVPFARNAEVQDNFQGSQETLATLKDMGTLTASCGDLNQNAGVENPTSTVSWNAATGVNTSRRTGNGRGQVLSQPAGTAQSITINGSNTFEFQIQNTSGRNLLIQGVVRQDGQNSASAYCLVYGTVIDVKP